MANEFVARRGIIAQSGGAKITGSLLVSGTIDASGYNIIAQSFTGSFSGSIGTSTSASYVDWTAVDNKPSGIVSSSTQVVANIASQTIAPNTVNATTITATTISGSTISGSFVGDGSQLTGIVTTLSVTGSDNSQDAINLKTEGLSFTGGNGVTATVAANTVTVSIPLGVVSSSTQVVNSLPSNTVSSSTQVKAFLPDGTVSSSAQYPGWVTASSQVVLTQTNGYSTFSSSLATVDQNQQSQIDALINKTGSYAVTASNTFTGVQTISNTTNSTNYTDGALIVQGGVGIAKDVNISGSLTVTGLLTAVSMSTQYVTSSQYVVGTSRVIVNDDDLVRFAGLSVIDSGSTAATGSLLWDSLKNHWVYEREDGGAYRSAVVIAGPKNYGALGNEEELVAGRIPVATGGDHIDSNYASSSLRIDFGTKETHVEAGLYITGSVTASVGFKGDGSQLTGIATTLAITGSDNTKDDINLKTSGLTFAGGNGITTTVASDTVTISAPLGTVSSSGQVKNLLPTDTVSSSTQVTAFLPADTVSSSTQVKAFLPLGTVSSSAQYPGWVTASSQVQLNQISGTTFANADFTFPQKLTITGVVSASTAANISNNLYSGSIVTNIVGAVSNQVIATLPSTYDGVFFDYVIKDGTNYRTGTVMVTANSTNVEFTDTSTNDIGNTVDEVFTVDIVGGLIRLKFTSGTGTWTVKTIIRAM